MKKHEKKSCKVALIHGGPGAAGEMAPVAEELSSLCGICEPFQTKTSIDAQLSELKAILEKEADLPVILVGFSWGAWLSYLFSAYYPSYVKKLILISSGPFEARYVQKMQETRFSKLNEKEKQALEILLKDLKDPIHKSKDMLLERLGALFEKIEAFDPLPTDSQKLNVCYGIYESISQEANQLRASGELLKAGEKIQCPVIAIHGDHDPHPAEGVEKPLLRTLKNFHFVLLKNCGHKPWIERLAKDPFYAILRKEISKAVI